MKKGFTLVEMLTVISLIAIIALVISRPVMNILKKVDKEACDSQNENIIAAAKIYNEGYGSYNNVGETENITVGQLIKYGYIEENIKNAITEEPIDKTINVIITRKTKNYYTYELERKVCEY